MKVQIPGREATLLTSYYHIELLFSTLVKGNIDIRITFLWYFLFCHNGFHDLWYESINDYCVSLNLVFWLHVWSFIFQNLEIMNTYQTWNSFFYLYYNYHIQKIRHLILWSVPVAAWFIIRTQMSLVIN